VIHISAMDFDLEKEKVDATSSGSHRPRSVPARKRKDPREITLRKTGVDTTDGG
jgi:hypothetical protein